VQSSSPANPQVICDFNRFQVAILLFGSRMDAAYVGCELRTEVRTIVFLVFVNMT
jgi:hypothetical protein